MHAREINPLPVETFIRSHEISVLVLAKQERAALSYQHGVRPGLRCNGMAADIAQLRGLVQQQAASDLLGCARSSSPKRCPQNCIYVQRYAFMCSTASEVLSGVILSMRLQLKLHHPERPETAAVTWWTYVGNNAVTGIFNSVKPNSQSDIWLPLVGKTGSGKGS